MLATKKFFLRVWDSPTINTWVSFFAQFGNFFLIFPLILNLFNSNEIAIFYLFSSVISFAQLADFGFKSTFIRYYAYAASGALEIADYRLTEKNEGRIQSQIPNWVLIGNIFRITNKVFSKSSVIYFFILVIVGPIFLRKQISLTNNENLFYFAWGLVCFASSLKFYSTKYECYLEGLNHIALLKRTEAFFFIISSTVGVVALLIKVTIVNFIIIQQILLFLNIFRIYYIFLKKKPKTLLNSTQIVSIDKSLLEKIWSSAWRTGVSSFMSIGIGNLTGILYSQIASSNSVASYLISLRILNQIKDVAQAPFYSKLPLFSQLRAQNQIKLLILSAKRGMLYSHIVFFLGIFLMGIFSDNIVNIFNLKTSFVSSDLWYLICFAYFLQRIGAMHLQLYLTTNHVISHILDGITGIVVLLCVFFLMENYGVFAFPISMITGYLFFYSWVSIYYTTKSLSVGYFEFEKNNLIVYVLGLVIFIIHNINK